MKYLEFEVNQSLEIVNFNEDFGRLSIPNSRSFHGTPYYELVPRIFSEKRDAVESVVEHGIPVYLKAYRFGCFFDSLVGDVSVTPIKSQNFQTSGAMISIYFTRECDFFYSFKKCQHLIDIGKNASILAHGVRNPLNAIKGSVAYLKNRYGTESELLEFTDIMEEEIVRLDKFITEFLSATNSKIEKQKLNLKDIISKIETLITLQVEAEEIEIEFNNSKELWVNGNLFQIEQAILNVINNAINVVKPKGRIIIEARKEQKINQELAVVEVVDDAGGVFQSPGKMDSSSLERFAEGNGKGFGLFISREVMKHHGGMLEIRSDKGKGTSVKLYLPLDNPKEG
jgi:two-component system nitrogen regulation sensor histidine kinase GlnL